jgi:hypothetical protein
MREIFVILIVIAALLLLTAFRYRRQLWTIYGVWRMMRSMQKGAAAQRKGQVEPAKAAEGPLVNCAKCSNWVPESRAVRLGPTTVFCSADCMEKAARPG